MAGFTTEYGSSLAYMIRDTEAVLGKADDPVFGEANSVYSSIHHETITHTLMDGLGDPSDNVMVYDLLRDAIKDHKTVSTWIKGHAVTRDGRAAWTTFKAHYLSHS